MEDSKTKTIRCQMRLQHISEMQVFHTKGIPSYAVSGSFRWLRKKRKPASGLWKQFRSLQTTKNDTISILFWLVFFVYLYNKIHYFSSWFFHILLAVYVLSPSIWKDDFHLKMMKLLQKISNRIRVYKNRNRTLLPKYLWWNLSYSLLPINTLSAFKT